MIQLDSYNILASRMTKWKEEEGRGRWMKKLVRAITEEGGEGLVMRRSLSPYHHGRSPSLLKLKVHQLTL